MVRPSSAVVLGHSYCAQAFGDRLEQKISTVVPKGVIDLLEMVEIDEVHCEAVTTQRNGDPEIAITQISAILQFDGVELAGPLPQDIQLYTVFVAAAPSTSNSDAVRAFLKAMVSPAATSILKEMGLEPPI